MAGSQLDAAIQWAAKLHEGQVRDGENALPYITHPLEVLGALRHVGGVTDLDMLVAAVLHDTIEECGVAALEIENRFGSRACGLVVELTRSEPTQAQRKGLSKEKLWRLRAEMLIADIAEMSDDAKVIKLADRLCNLQDAVRTKQDQKLARYQWQTGEILKTVSLDLNPALWSQIHLLLLSY